MSQLIESTPRKDGFYMPGEFERHAQSWLLWPERTDNWCSGAGPAQNAFARVAAAISRFEPVTVGVSRSQYQNARHMLPASIRVVEMSSDDAWIRDCGPTFVSSGAELRAIDWGFNAWGGLYSSWDQDGQVARKVAELERVDVYQAPIVLEGGSIHVDGEGTLITTSECLLNPNRNPGLSRAEIEATLKEYLNVREVIWLNRGVYMDETSGHVDNLCCFIRPGVVVLTWTDDRVDPQYEISRENFEILSAAVDARGRKLEIHKIHQPGPIYLSKTEVEGVEVVEGTHPRREGDRLPGSYINFYLVNGGVIVPQFNDPHDAATLATLQRLMPEREVVGVPTREILPGGGNIHCITQQQPAVP